MPTFANDSPFDFKKLKQSITGIMMVVLFIYILSYSVFLAYRHPSESVADSLEY